MATQKAYYGYTVTLIQGLGLSQSPVHMLKQLTHMFNVIMVIWVAAENGNSHLNAGFGSIRRFWEIAM